VLYELPPDPQAALIGFLASHTAVSAISGMRVSSQKIDSASPRIQVTALPGPTTEPFEQAAEFQIDCWGGTETQAYTLARTVCAAIFDIVPQVASITTAYPTLMPFASHDPDTGRPRFICQLLVISSPEATP